ncbi:kelch-like protein 18 [Hydractinia symbiolongicarpus]|uniref:kelch-like protein 18 n=1 Tax=Hydractinia symbiolongicarpus TaxID=13093 RepID=UPI00254A4C17|nr:kelch-like protein 18 [Hydractinia symbiolongicarpus]
MEVRNIISPPNIGKNDFPNTIDPPESEVFSLSLRPDILNSTIKSLAQLRRDELLCDVVLNVEGQKVKAHKVVLAATTPYFNAMFTNSMLESDSKEIVIHGMDADSLKALVNFMYGENLFIKVDNVHNLLSGASMLQIICVKDACVNFLMKKLHPENCLTVKSLADTFSCEELLDAANSFLEKNFVDVAQSDDFLQLEPKDLIELIKKDDLNVRSEEQIFEAVLSWIKTDTKYRSQQLHDLLCHVRLPLLSPQYLSDRVLSEDIIHGDIKCRDLIDEAKDYMLMPERRKQLKSARTLPRRCSDAAGLIYIVGGLTSCGESLSTVEKYDTISGKWIPVLPMAVRRSRVGVAILDNKLYAIGGFDGNVRLNDVERYDSNTNSWKKICPMNIRRSAVGAAVLGNKIYVVGGYDGNSSLNSVECYDPEMNQWKFVASMSTLRSAAGVTALNGKLYCAGGHDGLTIFSSVESYDSTLRQWRAVAPMSSRRCRLGLTVLNNRIYACGGYDSSSFLSSVEFYDAYSNAWVYVASMTQRRSRVSAVTLGGKIYAVGGYNGASNLSTIETYDPWANQWTSVTEMGMHDGGVGVGVLPRIT